MNVCMASIPWTESAFSGLTSASRQPFFSMKYVFFNAVINSDLSVSTVFSGVGNRCEFDNRQATWVITSSDFLYRLTSSVSFRYSFSRTNFLICFITSVNSLRRGSSR